MRELRQLIDETPADQLVLLVNDRNKPLKATSANRAIKQSGPVTLSCRPKCSFILRKREAVLRSSEKPAKYQLNSTEPEYYSDKFVSDTQF